MPYTGFEDQESHQAPSTPRGSVRTDSIRGGGRGVKPSGLSQMKPSSNVHHHAGCCVPLDGRLSGVNILNSL